MVSRLGAQYYVSVNFDEQTKAVMEKYVVLEKTEKYVVVKLEPRPKTNELLKIKPSSQEAVL
jgi:hypothetical protein